LGIKIEVTLEKSWFKKWTWKSVGWAFLCFIIIAGLNALLTVFLDIVIIGIGYIYVYFSLLFFTFVLYFFYSWLQINWLGIFSFGLCGVIGIPIDMWQEWFVEGTLKSPWGAVGWGVIYILYGLAADLSLLLLKPQKNETKAILLSALIFSAFLLLISILPLSLFYKNNFSTITTDHYLTYWYFLFPLGIAEGVIGAYAGMHLGKYLRMKQKKPLDQKNQLNNQQE
jgi:hypothetical protein